MMEGFHGMDSLNSAREILKSSIEKSRNVAIAIQETGSRLKETSDEVAFLQAAIKKMARECAVYEIRDPIDRTLGPAAAVLKVLDVVRELQDSLLTTDPRTNLHPYLANVKRFQEAEKLLEDNCRLVVLWLDDVMQLLKTIQAADDDWYLDNVSKVMKTFMALQGRGACACQNGGVLGYALDKLESAYVHLLTDYSSPFPAQEYYEDYSSVCYFPVNFIQDLRSITEVLAAKNRLHRCISIFAGVRSANVQATLQSLSTDYVSIQLSEFDSVQIVEGHIDVWDKHMEFCVRHLLQMEYKLCNEVFRKAGSEVWTNCFAMITSQCGFNDIFNFGSSVTKCKKDAIKLLMLLKIFGTLDKLRLSFNQLFGGKSCVEIRNHTRDLVKRVVEGTYEIFRELLTQVELQKETSPPPDGSVPRTVRFVTEYCNQLLDYDNSLLLRRILEIHQEWNNTRLEEGLLFSEISNIMGALELNLESWAKKYDDSALSCLFMMNSCWYLCNNNSETKLGEVMGHSWFWAKEKSMEYYVALYLKESWEKLLVVLGEEDLVLFDGGRAIDRDLVKKRIGMFCDAFDGMYKKQSKWVFLDEGLRLNTCHLVAKAIVPSYKSYLQKNLPEFDMGNSVRYTAESLENLINSLFQMKLGKFEGVNCTDMLGVMKNDVIDHFSSTPAAA
ncbi:exocyst complex component EXO70A1-like [Henckelia pumila]|uniref:exocyst complex component EXO70A1-like n=1 Tax=Henckelia pumila TaxID=405737 RepID=UPI003C6E853E